MHIPEGYPSSYTIFIAQNVSTCINAYLIDDISGDGGRHLLFDGHPKEGSVAAHSEVHAG